MLMEVDQRRYTAVMTDAIPAAYARHTLPGHQAIVCQGDFGILLSQVRERGDHSLWVHYFTFHYDMELFIWPKEACTSLCYAWENSCNIIPPGRQNAAAINIAEGQLIALPFLARKYTVQFQQGVYKSIHVTVSNRYSTLLKQPGHINRLLDAYLNEISFYLR